MISGGGRTLLNLDARIKQRELDARIHLVIASKPSPGAERARALGLPVLIIPGVIEPAILERVIRDHDCQWIVLGGYIKYLRLPASLAGKAVNIHPSLLPSFGGQGMFGMNVHQAVIDAGCKVSGCTVHLVDDQFDHGPILAQQACPVLEDDSAQSLAERVFALECDLYPKTLSNLFLGRCSIQGRRARIIP